MTTDRNNDSWFLSPFFYGLSVLMFLYSFIFIKKNQEATKLKSHKVIKLKVTKFNRLFLY